VSIVQSVITMTVFLPMVFCAGGGEMNTVSFYDSTSIADVLHILEKHGNTWAQPGSGMNQYVYGLAYDHVGVLYAVGAFTTAGGDTVNYIATWGGAAWADLDTGLNAYARAVVVAPDNSVYVGGNFTTVGTAATAAAHVAKWDGGAWAALGSGVDGLVYALAVDKLGNLYVGGAFANAGGAGAAYIAKWDGSDWAALGTGMNGNVYALAVDENNNLYAGGNFTEADGVTVNKVAKWDGSDWAALSTGMNDVVYALCVAPDGSLYAGGAFTTAGVESANYIARWDGTAWSPLGTGVNAAVMVLNYHGYESALYAGGLFTTANGISTIERIARWWSGTWQTMSIDLFGTPTVHALTSYNDRLALGFAAAATGAATTWGTGTATINNTGTVPARPKFVITRSGGTSATLTAITNWTTGHSLFFDWALMDGEEIVIDMTGPSVSITSSITGNQLSKVLPNSNLTSFALAPGINAVGVYITSAGSPTLEAHMSWETHYAGADGAAQ
jgi:hypothetical protein